MGYVSMTNPAALCLCSYAGRLLQSAWPGHAVNTHSDFPCALHMASGEACGASRAAVLSTDQPQVLPAVKHCMQQH